MRPVLNSSSFVPVTPLPGKLATIVLLAFSLFELVASLSQCLCSEKPLFTVKMASKSKSSYAGSASKPKRSRDDLSISEKVKILDVIEIKKNLLLRLPGCMARTNLSYEK